MVTRASPSSGPGKRPGLTPHYAATRMCKYGNRMSKDMFLTAAGKRGRCVAGVLTPEPSPDSHYGKDRSATPPPRTATPESVSSGDIPIGMAIGSLSDPPDPLSSWQPPRAVSLQPSQPPEQPPPRQQRPEPAPIITISGQKTQKRRFLGGLFGGKKHAGHREVDRNPSGASVTVMRSTTTTMMGLSRGTDDSLVRSQTMSGKAARPTPLMVRSNTGGVATMGRPGGIGSTQTATAAGRLLDVEIPDIRLERYSVMFSGLLNRPSSSLLARRNATLEKLTTANAHDSNSTDHPMQGRATSPQPSKSPATFTLFPMIPGRALQTPRMRSNALPGHAPCPAQPRFHQEPHESRSQHARKEKKTVKILTPRAMDDRMRTIELDRLREQQKQIRQRDKSRFFGPDASNLILDSPSSMRSENQEDTSDTRSCVPFIAEPQWQMLHPPPRSPATAKEIAPPVSARGVSSGKHGSESLSTLALPAPSSMAATNTGTAHVTQPSLDSRATSSNIMTTNDADRSDLQAAVETSIARQISISREQRQLLRPLQTNEANPALTARLGPASMRAGAPRSAMVVDGKGSPSAWGLGRHERVVGILSATPTLVVPARDFDRQTGAQNRKSSLVLIEGPEF